VTRVLILHGWTNRRPEGHWQRHLAGELRANGHIVSYPQMPKTDEPILSEWLEVLTAELAMLGEVGVRSSEELVVVAHSLGCIAWMQASAHNALSEIPNRLLLVAPPERQPVPMPAFETFVMNHYTDAEIREIADRSTRSITVVGSDQDVWQPSGIQAGVADMLGVTAHVIPGAKHFSHLDGFHRWQGVIDWVQNPNANIEVV
jgi:uncharacterized protein